MRQWNNDAGPISREQTTASGADVLTALAERGLDAAAPHRRLLVAVVDDLATTTERRWTVDEDEPLVALERALAHLVRRAPGHRSAAAGRLHQLLVA
jgi:hypothetical protein